MKLSPPPAAPPGGDQRVEVRHVVVRQRGAAAIDDERRLVQRQLRDPGRERVRRFERQDRAGGDAVDARRAIGLVDQGGDILDLPRDRVWCRVAAVAAPPAVIN